MCKPIPPRPRVYLAGAIWNVREEYARYWRERAKSEGPGNIVFIDPLDVELDISQDAKIVSEDLGQILRSAAVLVNAEEVSWGTAMEVFFAYQQHIPVIAFREDWSDVSPWLNYHTSLRVWSLSDALEVLERWYHA